MPTGYLDAAGVDFDDRFDPDVIGDGPQAPFLLKLDGTPMRYAALAYGVKGPDVGYQNAAGVDVSNMWAAKGTAVYSLPFNGQGYSASAQALSGQSGTIGSSVTLAINNNGTWTIGGGPNFSGSPVSGVWLPAGASVADFEVQFVVSGTGGSNGAPGYASCSTTRVCGVSAQVEGSSTDFVANGVGVTCRIRRISTGSATTTVCNFSASALGQV
jgi:hypothetical protein